MSALKPGWAEALGKEQGCDTEAESRMRRRGQRPFTPPRDIERNRARGARISPRTSIKARLDRALGPVTEDDD